MTVANQAVGTILANLRCFINNMAALVREGLRFANTNTVVSGLTEWTSDTGMEAFMTVGLLQRVLLWDVGEQAQKNPVPEIMDPFSAALHPMLGGEGNPIDLPTSVEPSASGPGSSSTPAAEGPKIHENVTQLISSIHALSRGTDYSLPC